MATLVDKSIPRKLPDRSDDPTSPGRLYQRQGNTSPEASAGSPNEDMRLPAFKKPRIDLSLMAGDMSLLGFDENSLSPRSNSSNCKDLCKESLEVSFPRSDYIDGKCSTCGDVGFPTELFQCTKGCSRLQHTYCSNSYNPRKRWFIGLCNWCEAEATAIGRPSGVGAAAKLQWQGSRRDAPWSSTSRVERTNAVECLLGAALRLPSAGFSSVEDLLQVDPLAGFCGVRRKPPSFDSVEKAKRSGPSVDNAVKVALKRLTTAEVSTEVGDAAVRSSLGEGTSGKFMAPSLLTVLADEATSPAPIVTAKKSPKGSDLTDYTTNSPACRDIKPEKRNLSHPVHQRSSEVATRRTSSCDSFEKLQRSPNSAAEVASVGKAKRALSDRGVESKLPKAASAPLRNSVDEKSSDCSSLESASRLKRRNRTIETLDKTAVEAQSSKTRVASVPRKELINRKSPKVGNCREGAMETTLSVKSSVDNIEKKKSSAAERASSRIVPISDELGFADLLKSRPSPPDNSENSGGGLSDCSNVTQEHRTPTGNNSNITQEQRTVAGNCWNLTQEQGTVAGNCPNVTQEQRTVAGKDLTSSPKKRSLNKETTSGRQLVRPNYIIGKSPRTSTSEEKLQRKIFPHKDSNNKLRRTSSKISGFHNYKSLSDILC